METDIIILPKELTMEMSSTISNNLATITISGIMNTLNAEKVYLAVQALPENVSNIEFDFEGLSYISSAGIRALLTAERMTRARGGKMTVVNACKFVCDTIMIFGFDKYFHVNGR